ncbi:MAG: DUF1501 domain-containing protein [Planctomycetes bacterium]|nr:DUF1501 domain-containing protein [Planctomycetota bacterium]
MLTRRSFLTNTYDGLRGIALASLLAEGGLLAKDNDNGPRIDQANPYATRPPLFEPKAKNVLMVFCCGALSQVDTFDYKPELIRYDGKPLPGNENLTSFQGENGNLTRPLWQFRPRGEVGKMVSDLVPQIGKHSDEICYLHSLTTKTNTHGPAENMMSTGFTFDGFPSMGSWISYALGTENQDLPSFVAIEDPRGMPQAGPNNWASGFLPAAFQGTPFSTTKPIRYLTPPGNLNVASDRQARQVLNQLNQDHLARFPGDQALAARIASYELAARMQMSIPDAAAVENESQHTLELYGADSANKNKAAFGRNCILARRLIERGVRFVQLFNGAYASGGNLNWDGHSKLKQQYDVHGEILDQPVAGLLADLKQRGLLESTLVVFCTEFGRMPMFQMGTYGRDHNPNGFTCWLAGAGVKTPYSYGATDEFGFQSTENVISVHDFHATILHLLGLDHERLTFYHNGIERRLTNVHGTVIREILA